MSLVARTVSRQLELAAQRLAAAGIDTPRVDAEWLLADVLGVRRAALWTEPGRALDDDSVVRYGAAVRRREAREPLQQITGWQDFRGLRLRVTPDVLVPRPETELLVDWALELFDECAALGGVGVRCRRPFDGRGEPAKGGHLGAPRVIDVGTGSGCIACALAAERPGARVLAIELSPRAAAVARANVVATGVGDRVSVVVGNLLGAVAAGEVDLIVANPPYLASAALVGLSPEVARHDPRAALDGGVDGLTVIRRLATSAARYLLPGGALLLETSGGEQTARVAALLRNAGLSDVATRRDLAGVERFVAGRRR
ncbi:MAG: peptide chain release factor N(5)-glutamine methyltransferase [Candidatus Rokuibacteriota bacterium]